MDEEAISQAEEVAPEEVEAVEEGQASEVEDDEAGEEVEPDADDNADGDAEGEDEEDQEEDEEPEEVEINIGGEKLRVPKGSIPDDVLNKVSDFSKGLEASFTKKFQEVSETRKSVEARAELVERLETMQAETLDKYSHGLQLKRELEALKGVNMDELWRSQPDKAQQAMYEIQKRERELHGIIDQVNESEAAYKKAQSEAIERQREEGIQTVERQIKGFREKHLPEVIDYAVKSLGIDKAAAEAEWALNPPMVIAAYKAMMYDQMQAKAKARPSPKQQPAKPVTPIQGKSAKAQKSIADMTPSEMAKYLGMPG